MDDDYESFLPLTSNPGPNPPSRARSPDRGNPPSYQSFDNPALSLDEGETHLTEVKEPLPPQSGTVGTVRQDADAVSITTIEDNVGGHLSGEEILFRLRLAHIHGDLNWTKHLRRLHDRSREDVHMEILDTLREQPIDIHQKKKLSRYLRGRLDAASVSSLTTNADSKKRKDRRRSKFKMDFGIWNGNIGRISAYFGSHVASHFVFLKFLVYLDILLALVLFGLVTLPQIISDTSAAPAYLTGDFGAMSTSVMFFAAYSDTKWGFYDRPLAYFLTWASVNVLCFLIIVASMYIKYSVSKRTETSEDEFPFSVRVFCSWDHTLSRPEGAVLHRKAIVTLTKEMVREERSTETRSYWQAFGQLGVRVMVNVFVLCVLGGSGYVIYLVADNLKASLNISPWIDGLIRPYKLPLVVAALKALVPPLFDQVIRLEKYAPRTELKVTIVRTAVFYLASLVSLLLSMYQVSSECIDYSNSTVPFDFTEGAWCCWENDVGEMVFKVTLIDLGQIILTTLLFDYLRAALIKCGNFARLGYREFAVASEVLDVIYGQSLVWLGLFFSPLLAVVGVLKLVVVFYFGYLTARMCKVPPRRVFRASRSGNFFMFILLVNFFVCLFTMTYAIIEIEPSSECGPFKRDKRVYNVLTSRVGDLPSWLSDVMVYISTPAVVVPLILFLLLAVLYFKAKAASYVKVIAKLREQLKFERRVEKRQVFARARFLQGQQMSSASRQMQLADSSSGTSLSDTYPITTSTLTTTTTVTLP